MTARHPAVGHLVSPYLFPTGSWIHSQLMHAHASRPVVITQSLENPKDFPFDPVYLAGDLSTGIERARNAVQRWTGSFVAAPYRRIARRHGLDLFHAHTGWEAARTAAVARACAIPLVASFYGRDVSALPRKLYWRVLYRRLFATADLFLVEGPHLGRSLARLGCPEAKIRTVHLGVDLERIPVRTETPHDGPARLLMSASLREKKGIAFALQALARCRDVPPWSLRILGDGPLRPALEAMTDDLGLRPRVTFEGHVPYSKHLEALRGSDIFLAPSTVGSDGDTEGGAPVALIEAQAAGIPAVATRHCDIPEVVLDGRTGVLVAEKDAGALAAAIAELLRRPETWPEIGREARRHIEEEFDVKRQVAKTEELYLDVLDRARPAAGASR